MARNLGTPQERALGARLWNLESGQTLTAIARCPEPRCRTRETWQLGRITFLPDDCGFGNTDAHPQIPETEGRRWVGTAAWISPQFWTSGEGKTYCIAHRRQLVFQLPTEPRKVAPRKQRAPRQPAQRLNLPKIIQFLDRYDSGEYGATNCPHCGADCRYVQWFTVEGGRKLGAAAGCIQLFPVSPVAKEHQTIIERQDEREKKGQKLASWDVEKLDAINKFYASEISEETTLLIIRAQNQRRQAYIDRRFRGRR